jgi:sugar O-acyltransferase (sialic acid O-acetyltransferase NeuD family)
MAISVVGLGAGGHAKVVIEILRMDSQYEIIGLLDSKPELKGQDVLGVPVLGDDTCLQALIDKGTHRFFVGLGSVGDVSARCRLYQMALDLGMRPVSAIHLQAVISPSATLGLGVTVMANAVINACAVIGTNVIVNTGAIVEHDCVIGDHAHIATGARLAGIVHVGDGSHIGVGASIRQYIHIGQNALVGAGAVVVKDVPDNIVVAGVPARILEKQEK